MQWFKQKYLIKSGSKPKKGWASNLEEVINEALRRYLDSHQEVLTESFIQDDVEWGLHGED